LKLLSAEVMEVPGALERFEREAKVMARLEHPGIVRVDDSGETDGRRWLRMELMPGRDVSGRSVVTLEDYVTAKGGRLPESEVKSLLSEILNALGHAHGKSLVHRDLKPANVLFAGERVKIADFGLVNAAGAEWMDTQVRSTVINQDDEDTLIDGSGTGSRSRAIMGTYAYMSPEQRDGLPADARSDLYALGLMVFRMLTGLKSPGMKRPSELGLSLDKGWDLWLIKTLEEEPSDRYATAVEMQEALDFQATVKPEPAPEAPKVKREPEPLPRPAPARPAAKPRRKQPAAAPVAPTKGSRTWLYLCAVALVVGLFAWSPWESGVSEVDEDDNEISSAPEPSREPSTAPVPAPEAPPPPKPRTPPKKVLPAPVNLSTSAVEGKPFAIADLSMDMLWVKPGSFEMGSPLSEKDRQDRETPHSVTLTEGYWLGKYEVTQSQWEKVMGSNPSWYKGADRPVETVSWTEVTSFCAKLTALERKAGRLPAGMTYQLPTEAQWEYACRAGTKTAFSFGDELTAKDANYVHGGFGTGLQRTSNVGEYPANAWGFHDMHGNVFEWCADWYGDYPAGAARDPFGPADGSYRVGRGGSWNFAADDARSAYRFGNEPAISSDYLGFRLSLRPAGEAEPQVQVQEKPKVAVSEKAGTAFTIRDLGLDLLWVKPGTFEMGSPLSEKDRYDVETPHAVTLTDGFYLGKHEVTQSQWEKVMGSNPSEYKGADRPVETVSWTDVTSFCAKLTASERAAGSLPAGMTYQLPTEAQWEYACRAGTKTAFSFGEASGELHRHANYADVNTDFDWSDKAHDDGYENTSPVGSYKANGWGFHDMHGNVWEWCADWYGDYPTGAARDPVGPAVGSYRVLRGGSWGSTANSARSAYRLRNGPALSNIYLGFRLSLRPASK
jgi:formylglycine-generating enzyme required for sulfatase activity